MDAPYRSSRAGPRFSTRASDDSVGDGMVEHARVGLGLVAVVVALDHRQGGHEDLVAALVVGQPLHGDDAAPSSQVLEVPGLRGIGQTLAVVDAVEEHHGVVAVEIARVVLVPERTQVRVDARGGEDRHPRKGKYSF